MRRRKPSGNGRARQVGPYRSRFEVAIAANLEQRGVEFGYESDSASYVPKAKTYTPDFIIKSTGIWVEAKGYFKSSDRSKLLAVKAQNPTRDIRLLFQRASNKLGSKSNTTYAQWAEQHGFIWAEGPVVPMEWT